MATEYLTDAQKEDIVAEVITKFLIPHFTDLGMNASGNWVEKTEAVVDVIRGPKYTEQLIYGRSPGTFAPIQPLKEWAMVKFGYDEQRATSMAYAVSNSLKQKGSTWYQQGGTDLIEILRSQEVADFITERASSFIVQQIQLEIERDLKQTFK